MSEISKIDCEKVQAEALGWMFAECCTALDRGEDPRKLEVSEMFERAIRDLSKPDQK